MASRALRLAPAGAAVAAASFIADRYNVTPIPVPKYANCGTTTTTSTTTTTTTVSKSAAVAAAAPLKKQVTSADIEGAKIKVVLGGQWGDEGKGKLVDILASNAKVCARFNGGNNAGHTLVVDGVKYAFHLLPCGIISKDCDNFIGNGVVLNIPAMLKELEQLKGGPFADGLQRLYISSRTSLLFDIHRHIDGFLEAKGGGIGTTKRGIGPCYSTKALRNGLRVSDLLEFDESFVPKFRSLLKWAKRSYPNCADLQLCDEAYVEAEIAKYREWAELLKPQIVDGVSWVHERIRRGDVFLVEGANAALLDIDFGTYPYCTSSSTTAGGVCTGLGIPPSMVECSVGVVKAFVTRVGNGGFPTECTSKDCGSGSDFVNDAVADYWPQWVTEQNKMRAKRKLGDSNGAVGDFLRDVGAEYGTTTGRPRRCGWMDIPLTKYASMINGYTAINLTKLDCLCGIKTVRLCVKYQLDGKDLPDGAFPDSPNALSRVQPVYEEFPGWEEDISKCRTFEELPANCQRYVNRIEELLECPIVYIGNGADREAMIKKY